MNDFWRRMANEKNTELLQVKVPKVIKEIVDTQPNTSDYVRKLIIADYLRRQQAIAQADEEAA